MKLALADLAALMRIVQVIFAVITCAVGLVNAEDVSVYIHRPVAAEAGGGGSVAYKDDFDGSESPSQTVTINYNLTSGTDQVLTCGVIVRNNDAQTVNSVTWNGDSLTFVGRSGDLTNSYVEIWYIINPDTGANDFVATLSAASSEVGAACILTTDTNQTTPLGTAVFAEDEVTDTIEATVSSASDELVVDFVVQNTAAASLTVDASQTERVNVTGISEYDYGMSTEGGAASVAMTWTSSVADQYKRIGAVPIKP